jgi:LacI family transcriptional regulator
MLGLVLPNLSNPFWATVAQDAGEAIRSRGYGLTIETSEGDPELELNIARHLMEHQVGGVIVAGTGSADSVATLREAAIPVVSLSHDGSGANTSVGIDSAHGAALAVQHLVTHGHEAIAVLTGSDGVSRARALGFRHAMSRRGLSVPEPWIVEGSTALDGGLRAGGTLLELRPAPTAVLVTSDVQAFGLLKAAATRGVRVPRDLAVVGFDGVTSAGFTSPGLTTVTVPSLRLAERAVERLFGVLDGHKSEERDVLLSPYLTIRGSCGCPEPF